uniref:Uncharacterized protein n=1 Tax=Sphaerodactylus townsendi TaxID=933632 RepID=A0ACB8FZG7_9SAUR
MMLAVAVAPFEEMQWQQWRLLFGDGTMHTAVNFPCPPPRVRALRSNVAWLHKTVSQEVRSLLFQRKSAFLEQMLSAEKSVADGVGGWRDYGVDPSQFSGTLMRTCERLVKEGRFVPSNPVGILTTSYSELLQNKVPLLGTEHTMLEEEGFVALL